MRNDFIWNKTINQLGVDSAERVGSDFDTIILIQNERYDPFCRHMYVCMYV